MKGKKIMKKLKLLSLVLVVLMILPLIPVGMFSVAAAGTAVAAPTVLPDGTAMVTRMLVDYTTTASESANISYTPGDGWTTTATGQYYTSAGQNTYAWRGAEGIMVAYDATDAAANVGFNANLLMNVGRTRADNGNAGNVQFVANGQDREGYPSAYYIFDGSKWTDATINKGYNATIAKGTKGYVYIPLDSFYYYGGSAQGVTTNNPKDSLSFREGMSHLSDQKIWKFGISANWAAGIKFTKAEFVYATDSGLTGGERAVAYPFTAIGNNENSAQSTIAGGVVTVTSLASNTATKDDAKVWVAKSAMDMSAADVMGFRFDMDASALAAGDDLQLRVRFLSDAGASASPWASNYIYDSTNGYTTVTSASTMQWVIRGVVYAIAKDGTVTPIVAQNLTNSNWDLFEALPDQFVGEIFVPVESMWLSVTGSRTSTLAIPATDATAAQYLKTINNIAFVHLITNSSGSVIDGTVKYSGLEVVKAALNMPTVTPNGTAVRATIVTDWSERNVQFESGQSTGSLNATTGEINITASGSSGTNLWPVSFQASNALLGLNGIMMKVDNSANTGTAYMYARILMNYSGTRWDNGNAGTVQILSYRLDPNGSSDGGSATIITGDTSTPAYFFDGVSWSAPLYVNAWGGIPVEAGKAGYLYIPATSLYFAGPSVTGATAKNNSIPLSEAIEMLPDTRLTKVGFNVWDCLGASFGDVMFVYEDAAAAVDANAVYSSANLKDGWVNIEDTTSYGTAATYKNGALTVTKMNNSYANAQDNFVWVDNADGVDKNAAGIRFNIDTSALANEKIGVKMRINFLMGNDSNGVKTTVKTLNTDGTVSETTSVTGWSQALCRSGSSVAYYYVDGKAVPLYLESVNAGAQTNVFASLPVGYVGEIFIPYDSFYVGINGNFGASRWLPFNSDATNAMDKAYQILVSHSLTAEPTGDQTVIYSNFGYAYAGTHEKGITENSVTINEDLSYNVYATLSNAVNPVATINGVKVNGVLVDAAKSGVEYKFAFDGILPQMIGDDISVEITDVYGTYTLDTSVLNYLVAILDGDYDASVKLVASNLIRYASKSQEISGYKDETLVTEGLESKLIAVANSVPSNAVTTAVSNGIWTSATLRLDSTLAIKLKYNVSEAANAVVTAKIGGAAVPAERITVENGAVILSISAADMDKEIAITITGDNDATSTLTYSVANYVAKALASDTIDAAEKELVQLIYNYGVSAAACAQ